MDNELWYLKRCDLFARLSPEEIGGLEARCRARTYGRGDLVYLPADHADAVLLVTSGRIKLYHVTAEGKEASLALVDAGELFGELAIFDRGHREEFAEAMEKSTVVLIPANAINDLMARHADFSMGVTKLMGLRRRRVEQRLKSLLFRSNRERLVHLLLELAEKYGQPGPEGVLLGIRLSHQELANIIGSTRETVTVQLGEMQDEGLLTIERRRLRLRSVQRLADSIGEPAPRIKEANPGSGVRGSAVEGA